MTRWITWSQSVVKAEIPETRDSRAPLANHEADSRISANFSTSNYRSAANSDKQAAQQ